jgi:hypothetical protein
MVRLPRVLQGSSTWVMGTGGEGQGPQGFSAGVPEEALQ